VFIRFFSSLREKGLRKTLRLVFRNIVIMIHDWRNRRFDRKYNIDTGDGIPIDKLDVPSSNKQFGEGYYATPFPVIDRVVRCAETHVHEFVFVDIGSGKGRVLFYAARYPFKQLIGLEFAPSLHAICEANIRRFSGPESWKARISSVCTDAVDFQFPDENLLIFMFNPFRAEVLRRVLDTLERHFQATRKKIYIAYYNPRFGHELQNSPFLRPIDEEPPILYVSAVPHWPLGMFEFTDREAQN
jgi:SAM-dependent methyltransferase